MHIFVDFLGIGVAIACDDVIFYVILKQEGPDGQNCSPEFKVVFVQIALVATLFIGPEARQHSYEVRMKLAQGYMRRWRFKIFLFLALADLVNWSETILDILVDGHLSNISMKFQ